MEDTIHNELVGIHDMFQMLEDTCKKHLKETEALLEENSIELFRIDLMIKNRNIHHVSKTRLNALTEMKATLVLRVRSYQRLIDSAKIRKQKLIEEKEKMLNTFFEQNRRVFERQNSLQRMVSFMRAAVGAEN